VGQNKEGVANTMSLENKCTCFDSPEAEKCGMPDCPVHGVQDCKDALTEHFNESLERDNWDRYQGIPGDPMLSESAEASETVHNDLQRITNTMATTKNRPDARAKFTEDRPVHNLAFPLASFKFSRDTLKKKGLTHAEIEGSDTYGQSIPLESVKIVGSIMSNDQMGTQILNKESLAIVCNGLGLSDTEADIVIDKIDDAINRIIVGSVIMKGLS
jgi:hypothetical protein